MVNVKVKTSPTGDIYDLQIENTNDTIGDFREQVSSISGIPSANIRLIFKGKILKDENTISGVGITENSIILLVRSKAVNTTATTTTTASSSSSSSQSGTLDIGNGVNDVKSGDGNNTTTGAASGVGVTNGSSQNLTQNSTNSTNPLPSFGFPSTLNANPTPQDAMNMVNDPIMGPMMQNMMDKMFSDPETLKLVLELDPRVKKTNVKESTNSYNVVRSRIR